MENFSHIELDDHEIADAIVDAKMRKEMRIEEQQRKAKADSIRAYLTKEAWTIPETKKFMEYRMGKYFSEPFRLDRGNEPTYELLCAYFSNDASFSDLAAKFSPKLIKNASLKKGILLAGSAGVGKTIMMQLFQKNHRQVYEIIPAKRIADRWMREEVSLDYFIGKKELPANDLENLYQRKMGLCIDDVGAEPMKNSYGNKTNLIADIIEGRYAEGATGDLLHLTTNLTAEQLKEAYGDRVMSRLREIVNIVPLGGEDRRK